MTHHWPKEIISPENKKQLTYFKHEVHLKPKYETKFSENYQDSLARKLVMCNLHFISQIINYQAVITKGF